MSLLPFPVLYLVFSSCSIATFFNSSPIYNYRFTKTVRNFNHSETGFRISSWADWVSIEMETMRNNEMNILSIFVVVVPLCVSFAIDWWSVLTFFFYFIIYHGNYLTYTYSPCSDPSLTQWDDHQETFPTQCPSFSYFPAIKVNTPTLINLLQ